MRGPIATLIAFVVATAASGFSRAADPEVAVVKDADLVQYNQVLTSFSVESKAHIVEYDIKQDADRAEKIFTMLKEKKPALVLGIGPTSANAAHRILKDTPLVFCMVPGRGFHLEGGETTGIRLELPLKVQLATLKTVAPKTRRVGIVYNPGNSRQLVEEAAKAAEELGLKVVAQKVSQADELADALSALEGKIDALWMIPDKSLLGQSSCDAMLKFTIQKRIPSFSFSPSMVQAGALVSLSPNYTSIGQQAAGLARKILNEGTAASTIAVADPEGLQLALNLSTARRIGVECNIALEVFTFAAENGYQIKVYK